MNGKWTAEDPVLVWVATKLDCDPRHLTKSLNKMQQDKVDSASTPLSLCGFDKKEKVFGCRLDKIQLVRANVNVHGVETPVLVAPFLVAVANRILAAKETVGLLRTPGNARRVTYAVDAINAGVSLDSMAELTVHDLCQLFKEWVKELTKPLIPEHIAVLMCRVFDERLSRSLSANEKGSVLRFFGPFLHQRARDTLLFASCLLHEISRFSAVNQMTTENIGRVCPTLFTGPMDEKIGGARAFAAPMMLVEFLVNNPHALSERLTADGILNHGPGFTPFVESCVQKESLSSSIVLPHGTAVKFGAQFKPPSPKRKFIEFNLRSPAQGIRKLMHVGMRSKQERFSRMSGKASAKRDRLFRIPTTDSKPTVPAKFYDAPEPVKFLDKNEIVPCDIELSSDSLEEVKSSSVSKSEDRFRSARRKSYITPVAHTPVIAADIGEMDIGASPLRLDFDVDEPISQKDVCLHCGRDPFNTVPDCDPQKPVLVDSSTQCDAFDFGAFQAAFQAEVDENDLRNVTRKQENGHKYADREDTMSAEKPLRMMSVMSVIPKGIVERQRLTHMSFQ